MTILLHACCAPCATHCIRILRERGDEPTLFYSNANIAPHEEYNRRLDALHTLARHERVNLLVEPPEHEDWIREVAAGCETQPEQGERCARCFRYSLTRTHRAMKARGLEAFTTTLTVSPHKPTALIHQIGRAIDPGTFLTMDFKKHDGYANSVRLAKEYGLYRQNYCGCEFSLRATQE